jgi:hypothetical protein
MAACLNMRLYWDCKIIYVTSVCWCLISVLIFDLLVSRLPALNLMSKSIAMTKRTSDMVHPETLPFSGVCQDVV